MIIYIFKEYTPSLLNIDYSFKMKY